MKHNFEGVDFVVKADDIVEMYVNRVEDEVNSLRIGVNLLQKGVNLLPDRPRPLQNEPNQARATMIAANRL